MRKKEKIGEAEMELLDKVWYNRHLVLREKIEMGECWVVDSSDSKHATQNTILKNIWDGALAVADKVEKKYGRENLGPYDDFEWGMVNGKLSALSWVFGEDWDMLDS